MFTGIIKEVGELINIRNKGNVKNIEISCKKMINDISIGDSVCANGVCLTVVDKGLNHFNADVSLETLNVSAFKSYVRGAKINLEQSLKLGDKLSGHIVLGHVDGTGKILKINKSNNNFEFTIAFPERLKRYISYKGSICIDGISLTVSKLTNLICNVSVIPFTYYETNLQSRRLGDIVNIEIDVIARYLENLIKNNSMNFLSFMNNNFDSIKY